MFINQALYSTSMPRYCLADSVSNIELRGIHISISNHKRKETFFRSKKLLSNA
jgi:3-dehydroquinate dehydratase